MATSMRNQEIRLAALGSIHTPGPWKVHPSRHKEPHGITIDVGPAGLAVCKVFGQFEQPAAGVESEANARLIAAAPELLEALKAAYRLRHLYPEASTNQARANSRQGTVESQILSRDNALKCRNEIQEIERKIYAAISKTEGRA